MLEVLYGKMYVRLVIWTFGGICCFAEFFFILRFIDVVHMNGSN